MTGRKLHVGGNMTVTLPAGAVVTDLAPDTQQVTWQSNGEVRPFTVTFTPSGRAVTQWFRRPETWPLLLNKLRSAQSVPHVYIGGVATGEEAYSLALLLEHHGIPARITATDNNPDVLAIAEAGVFTRPSILQATAAGVLPHGALELHLHPTGDGYRIGDRVRERVTFRPDDLRSTELPPSDVIMIRNVWRHLGDQGVTHLAHQVAAALPDHGVLSVGGADLFDEDGNPSTLNATLTAVGIQPVGMGGLYFSAG